ncbi:MAG TPA: hypothetical protein VF003_16465 [Pseudonocardiaceae bacterium]
MSGSGCRPRHAATASQDVTGIGGVDHLAAHPIFGDAIATFAPHTSQRRIY